MSEKKNCWEVFKCCREPGGSKAEELGACTTASEERLDGVHGGKCGGRACWVIAGTLCQGTLQGTFAKKKNSKTAKTANFTSKFKKKRELTLNTPSFC